MNVTAHLEMANKTDLSYSTGYIAVETVIGISAILGNILVIWAVKINSSLQNTTFFFIVSLAFADLAVGVLVMPLAIIVSLGMVLPFYGCLFMCCLMIILTNASILSLLAVSIDRYLRIKIPTSLVQEMPQNRWAPPSPLVAFYGFLFALGWRYKIVITPRRICLSIWLVWIVSILVGLVPMFGWHKKSELDYMECQFLSVISMDYMVYFNIFGWVFLPMFIILALYIEIFYLIRRHIRKNIANTRARGIFYGKEYKTAKSLVLVFLLFAISWLPLSILNCYIYFTEETKRPSSLQWFIAVAILLSHANSAMNPIVYAFKIKKFKDSYTQIIRTYILHKVMLSESSSGEHTLDEISQEGVE